MPLKLAPVAAADIPRLARIHLDAFYLTRLNQAIWYKGLTQTLTSGTESRHSKILEGDPSATYLKVVDSDAGDKTIAFAEWHIFETPAQEAERWDLRPRDWGTEVNVDIATDFWSKIVEGRQMMRGQAHCFLAIIATDPEHFRRGAGDILVKWGLEQADARKLPTFLDSSPFGEPLYLKHGFVEVDRFYVDLAEPAEVIDKLGRYKHLVMIRPAKPTST